MSGTCTQCSKVINHIHRHHVDGNRKHNDAKNLILLCPSCHRHTHSETGIHSTERWLVVEMDSSLHRQVRDKAEQLGMSMSAFIRLLVAQYFGSVVFEPSSRKYTGNMLKEKEPEPVS